MINRELHTEDEFITGNQHYAFKLRQLYYTDKALFDKVSEYLPFPVHINHKNSLDITYANNGAQNLGPEIDALIENGYSYLPEISCPLLLERTISKINEFKSRADKDEVCEYLQQLRVRNKMTYFFSNKLNLTENQFFNVSYFVEDMGAMGKLIKKIIGPLHNNQNIWKSFQSLTKQEKVVLKLLAEGFSNKEISHQLFIAFETVKVHRRNIYKKLDVHKTSQLVRFAMVLDII